MYQVEVIVKAAVNAVAEKEMALAAAIVKHYLMDDKYVPREHRQAVLHKVNEGLGKEWSLSFIKRANISLIQTKDLVLPEKVNPIPVTSVSGTAEIPASLPVLDEHGSEEARGYIDPAQPLDVTSANSQPTATHTAEQTQSNSNEEATMSNSTSNAAETLSEATQNLRVINLSSSVADLQSFMKANKEAFKSGRVLLATSAITAHEAREEALRAWVAEEKDRKKAFKKFEKHLDGAIKKFDNLILLYIFSGGENALIELGEAIGFINKNAKKFDKGSKAPFMRENDEGIKASWIAGATALAIGATDSFMNGFNVAGGVGIVAGAVGAYLVGDLIDEGDDEGLVRYTMAAAVGAGLGLAGSRIGTSLGEGNTILDSITPSWGRSNNTEESTGVTVVVNNPPALQHNTNDFFASIGVAM